MDQKTGKKRKPKKKPQPLVPNKKLKANRAKEEKPQSLENTAIQKFLEILLGDITREEFLSLHWQKEPFVTLNILDKLESLLACKFPDASTLKETFGQKGFYLQEDLVATHYEPETDQVIEMTERGRVVWQNLTDLARSSSIVFTRPYTFSPSLASLLQIFEKAFAASYNMRLEMTFALPGCIPHPPTSHPYDLFFIQLEGEQDVHVYTTPGQPIQEEPVVVLEEDNQKVKPQVESTHTQIQEQVQTQVFSIEQLDAQPSLHFDSIHLEKGDCLYIPAGKGLITYRTAGKQAEDEQPETTEANEASLDLLVCLPVLPTWTTMMDHIVAEAKALLARKQHLLSPIAPLVQTQSDVDLEAQHQKQCALALQSALDLQQNIFDHLAFSRSLSKLNFMVDLGNFKLRKKLLEHGGLLRIKNFLPLPLAKHIHQVLKGIKESEWHPTESARDYEHNNIEHTFLSSKSFAYSEEVFSIFKRLMPKQLMTVSAARYTTGHFIEAHDDNAFKVVDEKLYERDIAVVYYSTEDWQEADGGLFVDMFGGNSDNLVPEFNSLVCFVVPRMHAVSRVVSPKQRLSIFGWFLKDAPVKDAQPMEIQEDS